MHRYKVFFSAIALFCLALVPFSLSAQNWQENLKEAKQLYVNKMYQNAMALFQKAARQIVEREEQSRKQSEDLSDDKALIAVISAAIAAYESEEGGVPVSPDTFIVRSLRRR